MQQFITGPRIDPVINKIRGCLFGGAAGDALGAEIEFWDLARIRKSFPDGLTSLPRHDGRRAHITDDTQMTLFTAEGLICAIVRAGDRGICAPEAVVHHALLRWLLTQSGKPRMQVSDVGLVNDVRLQIRRAPGNTCLSALAAAKKFGDPANNDSKGCGTIMRVSPCALIADSAGQAELLARDTSALTHGHTLGIEAAVAFARILFEVFNGAPLKRAIDKVRLSPPIMAALEAALNAPRDGRAETVESLGSGWVAEEALAIAIYAALAGRDFWHGLQIAVTHSGDSDSTGAIAGNLLGLLYPDQAQASRTQLECSDLIARIARDLAFARRDSTEFAAEFGDQYPGW
ncbi:ADP-ribosylglycohydrolase family protein [Tabrizicola sp. J26]|uniref:ADP-ribosylglycohydrolase family protein n=1 Tax=Alitabrizicola rongguiensis TaxID=2909234 RepID=UPI001F3F5B1B|nr:ADP-ribosylglycohydrolase family protein [Tabrizicola rongguiensis]MCF1708703.1 ADP-ribosylglycohydrolase family protein [Tabrizicola rongguiensis]